MHDFGGLRVLVAEDEALLGFLLEEFLTDLNCRLVGPFDTLTKAADAAMDRDGYDVAILDVRMNGATIFGVAGIVNGLGKPIVFATGDPGQIPQHLRRHPIAMKPYTEHDICQQLLKALTPTESA